MSGRVGADDFIAAKGATARDLEDLPRVDFSGALPAINAGTLDLPTIAEEAWAALLEANAPPILFRYGGLPARIESGDDGGPVIRVMTQDRLRYVLARVAEWYTLRRAKNGEEMIRRPALPPVHVVRDMLARPDPPLPVLTRIVEAPIFAADGTLHLSPGYHPGSRTLYAPAPGFSVPPVPDHPSGADVERARRLILEDLLGDFPFVSEAERAHAVALLLLPFTREWVESATPLHVIEKPSPGTGATLLVDVLTYAATGHRAAALTEGRDEDEWRKRLTAKLQTGPAVVVIDNLKRRLEASAVSAAITADTWEDRLLGHTEMLSISVRCAWVATGNNPALSAEIARRTVRIRLDAKVDRPWLRDGFRHPDLRAWVAEHRGELVWAALVLGRAWLAAGRPKWEGRCLGMFESWSRVMGGILDTAGIPGFLGNLEDFYEQSDAEGAAWRSFVARWWERHEGAEVGVSDLWQLVAPADGDPLDLGLGDGSERSQKTRLGKLLAEVRDRQFDGRRIVSAGTKKRAQLWRLVPAGGER